MSLVFHLSLHILTAFIAGYVVWRFWRRPLLSFGAAFFGAVLIDLDHLIDYFMVFGLHFSLISFVHGEQFAQSEKIYVLFHGWEYVILLLGLVWVIRSATKIKVVFLAVALGAFFHLVIDVNINDGMTLKSYSILYRSLHHYEMEKIVTPEHYSEQVFIKNK